MHQWRYHAITLRDLSIAESKLNAEGEKGWELVAICMLDSNTARAFFKQPGVGEVHHNEGSHGHHEGHRAEDLGAAASISQPLPLSALKA